VALLQYVREQVKAGKSREEVVASTDIIKGFEDYGLARARWAVPSRTVEA
jgi:hypothetical protein